MKYRAIILDVDGTLIPNTSDGVPSEKVKEAIESVSHFMHVGIATSRPIAELHNIVDLLSLSGPSIIDGGAQIIDLPSKKILIKHPLKIDDYVRICNVLTKYSLQRFAINDDGLDVSFSPTFIPKNPLNIFIMINSVDKEKIIEELSLISSVVVHEIILWKEYNLDGRVALEITDVSATKQHSILEVAQILGISTKDIIGVGDGYNDFPLLMACGLKVAMGNAVEDLKAIADYIALPVEKDGVAEVINKFVL